MQKCQRENVLEGQLGGGVLLISSSPAAPIAVALGLLFQFVELEWKRLRVLLFLQEKIWEEQWRRKKPNMPLNYITFKRQVICLNSVLLEKKRRVKKVYCWNFCTVSPM